MKMQVVDRIASSGYSYISPTVDRACKVLPLLGEVKQRIEPFPPLLIQKADICIGTVYGVVEVRATALCDVVASTRDKAQKIVGESVVVARVHEASLTIVDTLDALIDRYLPEPKDKDGKDEVKTMPQDLIPRLLYIPFKIPVRMIHISIAKARYGCDFIKIQIEWAIQLTSDQKAKLQALVLSMGQAISEKVSSSSLTIALKQSKERVSNMSQIAVQSIDDGRKGAVEFASGMVSTASQRVYDVTTFVVGKDRATGIFVFVSKRLPFAKVVIHSSASTGCLSDSSSHEMDQNMESSTGATGKHQKPAITIPSKGERSAAQHEDVPSP